jgi:biopolymer transport protein ExbD
MRLLKDRKTFNVPMNAMSDVAFLLLIFIMLVALINYRQEVKIEYPEAANAKKVSSQKNMEIWIQLDGAIYLDGRPCTPQEIQDAVENIFLAAPDTQIHIIADRHTPYEHVNGILQILQLLEYRVVSFVVKDA